MPLGLRYCYFLSWELYARAGCRGADIDTRDTSSIITVQVRSGRVRRCPDPAWFGLRAGIEDGTGARAGRNDGHKVVED